MDIRERKDDHVKICLEKDVRTTYDHWDDVHLIHSAIPKVNLSDIDLTSEFLGHPLKAPLIISAMTGGTKRAEELNRLLARAAEEFGLGFGIGSQRAGLERPELEGSYSVVKEYDIPLVLGNVGAPQVANNDRYVIDESQVQRALDMIDAHAICIHLNYLQEVVQPEGETNVEGFLENLRLLSKKNTVVAKETGAGFSREIALTLKEAGVSAIDTAGASGTSFAAVESYRRGSDDDRTKRLGETFWDWGLPSPVSVTSCRVGIPIIASGGIRNGMDIVRAMSIGGDVAGMAFPILKAASRGYDELHNELEHILDEIRASLFLTGVSSVAQRDDIRSVITGRSREILNGIFQ